MPHPEPKENAPRMGSKIRVLKRGIHEGEVMEIVNILVEGAFYCVAPHEDGRGGIYLRLREFELMEGT